MATGEYQACMGAYQACLELAFKDDGDSPMRWFVGDDADRGGPEPWRHALVMTSDRKHRSAFGKPGAPQNNNNNNNNTTSHVMV